MATETELITADEAAAIVNRSRRTVQRWADAGTLPVARKLPGRTGLYLFHRGDVERLRDRLADGAAQ